MLGTVDVTQVIVLQNNVFLSADTKLNSQWFYVPLLTTLLK